MTRVPCACGSLAPELEGDPKERVLALDISSVCVGWSVFADGELVAYVKYHQRGKEHSEKLAYFQEWLEQQLVTLTPSQLVTEAPYSGRRRHTYGVLMMYQAVVLMAYFRYTGEAHPAANRFAAAQVKRLLNTPSGSSHAARKKIQVDRMNEVYGLSLQYKDKDQKKQSSDDDIADAIAVGRAWLVRYRGGAV